MVLLVVDVVDAVDVEVVVLVVAVAVAVAVAAAVVAGALVAAVVAVVPDEPALVAVVGVEVDVYETVSVRTASSAAAVSPSSAFPIG